MATTEMKITPMFQDGTTGTALTFGPFAPTAAAVTNAKANIIAFNADPEDGEVIVLGKGFVSNFLNESNSKFSSWSKAQLITTESTPFNVF